MAFTPPDFNVLANLWFGTNTPNTGLFDFENQECQLYVTSRGPFDVDGTLPNNFSPPIYFRMPWAANFNWRETQIVECPAGSLRYYSVRWKEYMHVGFPNQYLVIILGQCDGDGNPILRDVGGSISPSVHYAYGLIFQQVNMLESGDGTRTHVPVTHDASASLPIGVDMVESGSGTNT